MSGKHRTTNQVDFRLYLLFAGLVIGALIAAAPLGGAL